MNGSADIFDIERYAVEDGPGIRSVVFFKGCNLRCRWCQNPESHRRRPEVMYYRNDCVGCRRCVEACQTGALSERDGFGFISDPDRCTLCGACIDICFTGARKMIGRSETLDAIMEELGRDLSYYAESGGGVTFSGGEALLQSGSVAELARRCRIKGIHTALETAGAVPWSRFEEVLPWIDLLYFDLKHIDSDVHRDWTDVSLEQILANLEAASRVFGRIIVRIPIIPGVNDSEDILRRIFAWLKEHTAIREVELLPFHRLGQGKYEGLGRIYEMADRPNLGIRDCEPLADIGRAMGLTVRSGGSGS